MRSFLLPALLAGAALLTASAYAAGGFSVTELPSRAVAGRTGPINKPGNIKTDASIMAVPEPATQILLAVGTALILLRRKA